MADITYRRRAIDTLRVALARKPAVLLAGARQTGKTTLANTLAADGSDTELVSLDDAVTLAHARRDPAGFVEALGPQAVIDEAQRAPSLLPLIRRSIDRDRRPGRFLLVTSAAPGPGIGDWPPELLETVWLQPLSQGEIGGQREAFVDAVFAGDPEGVSATSRDELMAAALVGGYPRVQSFGLERRAAWFRSYISTLLDRDVRDLARVAQLAPLAQLLGALARRPPGPLNAAGLSQELGAPNTSLRRYLALLEAAYLTVRLPAWTADLGKRLAKAPKLLLIDTGLIAHLALFTEERLVQDAGIAAFLLETFAVLELLKQAAWSRVGVTVSHFRMESGRGVALVLEARDGTIVGVDVKAIAGPSGSDLRGLRALRDLAGRRFRRGVLLYLGRESGRLEDRLSAAPLNAVWDWSGRKPRSVAGSA